MIGTPLPLILKTVEDKKRSKSVNKTISDTPGEADLRMLENRLFLAWDKKDIPDFHRYQLNNCPFI